VTLDRACGVIIRYSLKRKYARIGWGNPFTIDLQTGNIVNDDVQDGVFSEDEVWLNDRFGVQRQRLDSVELHSDNFRGGVCVLPSFSGSIMGSRLKVSDYHIMFNTMSQDVLQVRWFLYAPLITTWSRKLHWCLSLDFKRRVLALLPEYSQR
jgi:hypothetical protein